MTELYVHSLSWFLGKWTVCWKSAIHFDPGWKELQCCPEMNSCPGIVSFWILCKCIQVLKTKRLTFHLAEMLNNFEYKHDERSSIYFINLGRPFTLLLWVNKMCWRKRTFILTVPKYNNILNTNMTAMKSPKVDKTYQVEIEMYYQNLIYTYHSIVEIHVLSLSSYGYPHQIRTAYSLSRIYTYLSWLVSSSSSLIRLSLYSVIAIILLLLPVKTWYVKPLPHPGAQNKTLCSPKKIF